MKLEVELMNLGHRTKAISHSSGVPRAVKVIPQQYVSLVQKIGFVDVRSPKKLTLTAEERLLLYIHQFLPKLKPYYAGFQVDEIQLESKSEVYHRESKEYTYTVRIKDATEINIPYNRWKRIKLPVLRVNQI